MQVAKQELARECDYFLEASNQKRYKELLSDCEGYYVPKVTDELSSKKVLTSEFVPGTFDFSFCVFFVYDVMVCDAVIRLMTLFNPCQFWFNMVAEIDKGFLYLY
jgi:hypothetical protein